MNQIFYIKKGKRYIPVKQYDPELCGSMPYGAHLVVCKHNSVSRKYSIDPAFAPMIAAGAYAADEMCTAMINASVAKPTRAPLTPRQLAAWNELKESFDDEHAGMQYNSFYDVVAAGVKAMEAEAAKLLQCAAVKEAYDQFMCLAKLAAKEQKNG